MNQLELLDQLIGKDNSVIVSRLLVRIFGGLQEGAFIQQLYYWSSRTSDPEGWIHKTHEDWYNECFATKYTISKLCKEYDFIKTDRRKSPFYQWQPVNVYHLDRDAFLKFLQKHEAVDFGTENILRSEDEIFDVPIEQQNFDVPINNEYTENITINAAGVDDDKTTSQLIDEIPSAGWDSLTPAWQKVTPLIAEYYGLSESDGLCKVLACYFTRESRHIKKGSEWAEYHLETALTVDQLKTLLQHWKTSLPAMPTKPMTIQANVSKWKHAQTEDKFDFDNPLWVTH